VSRAARCHGPAEPLPAAPAPLADSNITFAEPAVLSAPPPQPAEADVAHTLDHDLSKLRQTVEQPKRGGLFRRRG
jgi:hypothetical protein